MSKINARGEKRKCQNDECDASFYDLNRKEFDCPICGTAFDHEAHAACLEEQRAAVPNHIRRRQARTLPIVPAGDAGAQSTNDNAALVEDEASDGEVVADDDAAAAETANIIPEEDEDTRDPRVNGVPLSDADNENN